ncbi:MAG: hypothetical protein ACK4RK_21735 [Gemmataceae bacterium]
MLKVLTGLIGGMTAAGIRTWVRLTGRRVARQEAPWLECPMGPAGRIGGEFYAQLAESQKLKLLPPAEDGLLSDFTALRGAAFDPDRVCPQVHDFYEHTSCYDLAVWSEAPVLTRFFLWGLTTFVSRRMDQLNFPISSLELTGGMTNEILPLVSASGDRVYTGWLRRRVADGGVVYAGLYRTGRPGGHPDPCVKVSFPLPRGSATVFFRPEAQPDGSFKLISSGSRFGDPGFYRMVEAGPDHWRVRYIRTLREFFHLYVDARGVLRTDHMVRFLGITVFRMHYKLERVRPVANEPVASEGGAAAGKMAAPGTSPGGDEPAK